MIESIFPTPMYAAKVDNFSNIQKDIGDTLDTLEFSYIEHWGKTHLLAPASFNENIIPDSLNKELERHVNQYLYEIGKPAMLYDIVSWFTKCEKGNYAHVHNHGAADLSGVYYYQTNGKDGNIYFHTPNPFLDTTFLFSHMGTDFEHEPMEGKLIIFPGWLLHGVRQNSTDNTRISLSFNITFKNAV